jgi:hypothetical protein
MNERKRDAIRGFTANIDVLLLEGKQDKEYAAKLDRLRYDLEHAGELNILERHEAKRFLENRGLERSEGLS